MTQCRREGGAKLGQRQVGTTAEIDGSLMQGQAANGCPEVQRIAVGVAGEAVVTLPREMH
ncbi:MAG: hypothetical protein ABSD73_12675 [Candidatus Bathyarchaeia archaeon]